MVEPINAFIALYSVTVLVAIVSCQDARVLDVALPECIEPCFLRYVRDAGCDIFNIPCQCQLGVRDGFLDVALACPCSRELVAESLRIYNQFCDDLNPVTSVISSSTAVLFPTLTSTTAPDSQNTGIPAYPKSGTKAGNIGLGVGLGLGIPLFVFLVWLMSRDRGTEKKKVVKTGRRQQTEEHALEDHAPAPQPRPINEFYRPPASASDAALGELPPPYSPDSPPNAPPLSAENTLPDAQRQVGDDRT